MSKLVMVRRLFILGQSPSCHCSRQQGFSLLEILVAFSILAMSISVILNIFSSGVRAAYLAEEYTIAVQMAESLLVTAGVETKLQSATTQSNDQEKFQWQVDVSPINLDIAGVEDPPYQVYQVQVKVFWQEGESERQVVLQTLKLGEPLS